MAILSFQFDLIGQTGQVPKFIYLQTNDLASDVVHTGYLNGVVAQGAAISQQDMALVSIKDSPYSKMYNIQYSAGNWSLVAA